MPMVVWLTPRMMDMGPCYYESQDAQALPPGAGGLMAVVGVRFMCHADDLFAYENILSS